MARRRDLASGVGVHGEGDTPESARADLREALLLVFEEDSVPDEITAAGLGRPAVVLRQLLDRQWHQGIGGAHLAGPPRRGGQAMRDGRRPCGPARRGRRCDMSGYWLMTAAAETGDYMTAVGLLISVGADHNQIAHGVEIGRLEAQVGRRHSV